MSLFFTNYIFRLFFILFINLIGADEPPRIIVPPRNQTVIAGKTANIACIAVGDPTPDVEWRRGEKRLVTQRFVQSIPNGSVIRIEAVKAKRDDAVYECLAENGIGEPVRASAILNVIPENEVPRGFPKFILQPTIQGIEKGRKALLSCKTEGSPKPTVYWLKNFVPINMSNPKYSFYEGTSLLIENTDGNDQGHYECVAENEHGVAYSSHASLLVRIRSVAPYFSIPPEPVYELSPGSSINVTCVAAGSPMPHVFWKKEGREIQVEGSKPVGRNVLLLEDVRESANYTCVADSSDQKIEVTTQIVIQSQPRPPTNVRVSATGPTSIDLEWTYDMGNDRDYFVILYKPKNSDSQYSEISGTHNNFYKLTQLTPFTEYEFRIIAANKYGRGQASAPIYASTGDTTEFRGAPRNLQARAIAPTSVVVMWEPPEQPLGKISGYKVYYTTMSHLHLTSWQSQKVDENCLTKIQDLQSDVIYTIKVSALTESRGEGPLSAPTKVRTVQGVPSQPQNLRVVSTTPTSVQLSWKKPISSPETIIGYEIFINDTYTNTLAKRSIPVVESFKLDELHPDTLYYIRVAAKSRDGEGAATPDIPVKTDEFVPSSPPTNIEVKVLTSRMLNVSWSPPPIETQNGAIIFYEIFYCKWNKVHDKCKDDMISVRTINANSTYLVLNDLEEWTLYGVQVLASTKKGVGPKSLRILRKTLDDVPGEPRNVTALALNSTTIRVQWSPPSNKDLNGVIIGYYIYVTEISPDGSEIFIHGPKNPNFTIDKKLEISNLQPDTLYTVQVAAITGKGDGSRSAPVKVRTHGGVPTKPEIYVRLISDEPEMVFDVTWSRPNHTYGNLKGYKLKYGREDETVREEEIINPQEQGKKIKGLDRGVRYEFRLSGINSIGRGQEAIALIDTPEGVPKATPQNLSYRLQSPTTVKISWGPPLTQYRNGRIIGYGLHFGKISEANPSEISTNQTTMVFSSLDENAEYVFKVRAYTAKGPGPFSSKMVLSTPGDAPSAPNDVQAMATSEQSIMVWWVKIPFFSHILGYKVFYSQDHLEDLDTWLNKTVVLTWSAELTSLNYNALYSIRVAAFTKQGIGRLSEIITIRTIPHEVPMQLRAPETKTHTITLTWRPPTVLNPIKYTISYGGTKDFFDSERVQVHVEYPPVNITVNNTVLEYTIEDLSPFTTYTVNVTAIPPDGSFRPPASIMVTTEVAAPKPLVSPDNMGTQDGCIVVVLPLASEELGAISHYFLVVVPSKFSNRVPDSFILEELNKTRPDEEGPYIAAKYAPRKSGLFLLGDDKIYNGYRNRKLSPNGRYKIFVRAVVDPQHKNLYTNSPFSKELSLAPIETAALGPNISHVNVDGSRILGIGVIIVVSLSVIVIVAVLILINRRRQLIKTPAGETTLKLLMNTPDPRDMTTHPSDPVELRRLNYQTRGMMSHPPIPVTELANHIEILKENDNLKFSQEYESIEPGQQFTWDNSNMEINKPKNRYANVIAYDHSRVVLQPIDGIPGSDYINANYCDGYRKQNAYIATQGPLPETVEDFWRMVWEQRSYSIVMMTKLEERTRVKCDQYWPTRGTEGYGCMQVTLTGFEELSTYCIRTFTLQRYGFMDSREVRQFQFTAWPDHGVPDHPTPFLMFLRRVKTMNPPDAGPMIIHCSAGVGRTGCFIVIDSMIEKLKYENIVDIYGHVTCLRAQRNYMVQTEDQYIFIHDAVLEAVISGNVEIPIRNLYNHVQILMQIVPGENITGMELEFKKIAAMKNPPAKFISSNLPVNKLKNRQMNILPYESSRVCLEPLRGVEGSDYINANFIDGYRYRGAYIATQGPMAETTEDFWRMLWEHNSNIIVMLTKIKEMGREKCHHYWPSEKSQRYLYFVVDPITEYNMPQYILREFKVTDARDGESRTVRQFHFVDWPEQGVTRSGEGFIDFITQVHKTKEQFGQEGPITVHCSGGVGRTGVFISLSIVLERIQNEGVIDLFTTVRTVRTQRPGMVQTEDQYQFCYRAALEYISTFDYAS